MSELKCLQFSEICLRAIVSFHGLVNLFEKTSRVVGCNENREYLF